MGAVRHNERTLALKWNPVGIAGRTYEIVLREGAPNAIPVQRVIDRPSLIIFPPNDARVERKTRGHRRRHSRRQRNETLLQVPVCAGKSAQGWRLKLGAVGFEEMAALCLNDHGVTVAERLDKEVFAPRVRLWELVIRDARFYGAQRRSVVGEIHLFDPGGCKEAATVSSLDDGADVVRTVWIHGRVRDDLRIGAVFKRGAAGYGRAYNGCVYQGEWAHFD